MDLVHGHMGLPYRNMKQYRKAKTGSFSPRVGRFFRCSLPSSETSDFYMQCNLGFGICALATRTPPDEVSRFSGILTATAEDFGFRVPSAVEPL